jgi:hypothetical protein
MGIRERALCVILFALAFGPSSTACAQASRDRYGLAAHSDVYVVHQVAKNSFLIERSRLGVGSAAMTSAFDSARLQQKLDLEDPVVHVQRSIANALREQLALTNLRVLEETSHLTVLPLTRTERLLEEASGQDRQRPPGGGSISASEVRPAGTTFNEKYPTGAVIEVVTEHWGLDDYRIKYYASIRVVDLGAPKVLVAMHCPWVILDPIDAHKLFFEAGAGGVDAYGQTRAYVERAEGQLYGNEGALLKATLRQAAEDCAGKIIPRLLGTSRARR